MSLFTDPNEGPPTLFERLAGWALAIVGAALLIGLAAASLR